MILLKHAKSLPASTDPRLLIRVPQPPHQLVPPLVHRYAVLVQGGTEVEARYVQVREHEATRHKGPQKRQVGVVQLCLHRSVHARVTVTTVRWIAPPYGICLGERPFALGFGTVVLSLMGLARFVGGLIWWLFL